MSGGGSVTSDRSLELSTWSLTEGSFLPSEDVAEAGVDTEADLAEVDSCGTFEPDRAALGRAGASLLGCTPDVAGAGMDLAAAAWLSWMTVTCPAPPGSFTPRGWTGAASLVSRWTWTVTLCSRPWAPASSGEDWGSITWTGAESVTPNSLVMTGAASFIPVSLVMKGAASFIPASLVMTVAASFTTDSLVMKGAASFSPGSLAITGAGLESLELGCCLGTVCRAKLSSSSYSSSAGAWVLALLACLRFLFSWVTILCCSHSCSSRALESSNKDVQISHQYEVWCRTSYLLTATPLEISAWSSARRLSCFRISVSMARGLAGSCEMSSMGGMYLLSSLLSSSSSSWNVPSKPHSTEQRAVLLEDAVQYPE